MSEIEILRDRVDELETLLGLNLRLPSEFGFTATEMKYVGVLIRRPIASRDVLYNAVYGGLTERDPKIVDVYICKIRRKLKVKGLGIKNYYGEGYYLDDDTRAALKRFA